MEDYIGVFYNNLFNNNFYSNDRNLYKYFETFVLKLLEEMLSKENKPLIKYPREEYLQKNNNTVLREFDAIAPEGINGLKGPTLIEIKKTLSNKSIQSIARLYLRNNKEFNSYLIIVGTPLDKSDKKFLQTSFELKLANKESKFEIWDLEKITELASLSNDVSKRILDNLDN